MLAKGSLPWVFTAAFFTVASGSLIYFTGIPYLQYLTYMGFALTVFFLYFFRDPERHTEMDNKCMVAPADGKVIDIRQRCVCIFMNFQNVHVNRSPLSGTVRNITYKKGGYIPAYCKDSDRNERNHIFLDSEYGEVCVTQIAGAVTRRIVSYVREGDTTLQGQKIGMIRFGSRVDVTIPESFEIVCKKGDRVRCGETVVARLK
ncbi:MAG: phosphatidylserine decarboxylase [Methanosarcinaceae archaeon]|nr:phosphatidylserine decarboxylase [Methanosarcinaceae archaeon]